MPEYIDFTEARAFVEANYQGDPILRHLYGTLLDKLPTVPDRRPMFLLKSAPADADILKTLASSPVIYSTGEETIIPLMPDRWIPVTERLPDDDIPSTTYLCFWKGTIRVCKYWRTRKCFEFNGRVMKVTHWMPLPEPPKEESHG